MTSRFLIYGLIDPRSGELRYVGMTTTGMARRMSKHINRARSGSRRHVYCWLRQLLAAGLRPEVEVLEEHESSETLYDSEQHNIAYWRFLGADLTNHTDGGPGLQNPSQETRSKISASKMGKKRSPATVEKIRAAHLGTHPSAATRLLMSRSGGGKSIRDQNGVIYLTQAEAARQLNLSKGNINNVLHGRYQQTGGYTFRYVE